MQVFRQKSSIDCRRLKHWQRGAINSCFLCPFFPPNGLVLRGRKSRPPLDFSRSLGFVPVRPCSSSEAPNGWELPCDFCEKTAVGLAWEMLLYVAIDILIGPEA